MNLLHITSVLRVKEGFEAVNCCSAVLGLLLNRSPKFYNVILNFTILSPHGKVISIPLL